jgi:hypothetical protein
MIIEGHELRDLKKILLTSKEIKVDFIKGRPFLIISDENLKTKTYIDVGIPDDEKDIA